MEFYQVRARLALLQHQFEQAETIYLEENAVGEMLNVYRSLNKWDALLQLADVKRLPESDSLKKEYYAWLMQTQQEDKAAEVFCQGVSIVSGINLEFSIISGINLEFSNFW